MSESPIVTDSLQLTGKTSNEYFFDEIPHIAEDGMVASPEKLTSPASLFDLGSTRGTRFIPGYQGFLPTSTRNAERFKSGLLVDRPGYFQRTVLADTRFVPGYTGFRPADPLTVK